MKKLSLLIALMLCVTIGGVYATWSYAGTNDIADAYAEAKITIAGVEFTEANGTYKIESNLAITVDQTDLDDHTAKLVFSSNDSQPIYLRVIFDPAPNAPVDIKNAGVASKLSFGTTTTMQYPMDDDGNYSATGTATDILTFQPAFDLVWTEDTVNEVFTYTMDQAALEAQIKLNGDFVLDTKAEYDAFHKALNGNIEAHVTDGVTSNV